MRTNVYLHISNPDPGRRCTNTSCSVAGVQTDGSVSESVLVFASQNGSGVWLTRPDAVRLYDALGLAIADLPEPPKIALVARVKPHIFGAGDVYTIEPGFERLDSGAISGAYFDHQTQERVPRGFFNSGSYDFMEVEA